MAMVSGYSALLRWSSVIRAVHESNNRHSGRIHRVEIGDPVKRPGQKIDEKHKNGDEPAPLAQASFAYGLRVGQFQTFGLTGETYMSPRAMSIRNSIASPASSLGTGFI